MRIPADALATVVKEATAGAKIVDLCARGDALITECAAITPDAACNEWTHIRVAPGVRVLMYSRWLGGVHFDYSRVVYPAVPPELEYATNNGAFA